MSRSRMIRYLLYIDALLYVSRGVCAAEQSLSKVDCPEFPLIRQANKEICIEEASYVGNKSKLTKAALVDFLSSLDLVQFDQEVLDEIERRPPIFGLAISGGGYRSMLTATGFIQEMQKWQLFDTLTYISGLSGGSWVLMDLIMHDFEVYTMLSDWNIDDGLLQGIPDFDVKQKDLVSGMNEGESTADIINKRNLHEVRDFTFIEFQDILDMETALSNDEGANKSLAKRGVSPLIRLRELLFQDTANLADSTADGNTNISKEFDSWKSIQRIIHFYIDLHMEVRPKRIKGFPVSFTDYLGKAFVKNLGNYSSQKGNNTSLSQLLKNSRNFQKFRAPIPIIVANCKNGFLKNVIFEFTPFEFGSWDSMLRLFVKLPYLGSTIRGGKSIQCLEGYDDIGFITATSSSIFNNVLLYIWELTAKSSRETVRAVKAIMSLFGLRTDGVAGDDLKPSNIGQLKTDYAVYHPNPFFEYPGVDNVLTSNDYLYLVDGGEDGENIPLRTLMVPERKVDVIFILDSSSDEDNYPNGRKLQNVFRQLDPKGNWSFPSLNSPPEQPVAFGCYTEQAPVLIYYQNARHSYASNVSTFKIIYNETEIFEMVKNGGSIFNLDSNEHHKNCLACLLLKRTFDSLEPHFLPPFCRKCFESYCH